MNVSLTPELESVIDKKVRTGRYGSASEVVREALRLLENRDRTYEARLVALRKEIIAGIAQAGGGETVSLDMEALKAKARRRKSGR